MFKQRKYPVKMLASPPETGSSAVIARTNSMTMSVSWPSDKIKTPTILLANNKHFHVGYTEVHAYMLYVALLAQDFLRSSLSDRLPFHEDGATPGPHFGRGGTYTDGNILSNPAVTA